MTREDTPQLDIDRQSRRIGIVLLVIAAVLWSINGGAVKLVDVPTIGYAFWRSFGAMLAGLGVVLATCGAGFRIATGPMLVAALFYSLQVTLLIFAMRLGTAAMGVLLLYTGPAWVALLGWLLLGRRISRKTATALGIAGLGVVIMIVGLGRSSPAGIACGLAAGLTYGAMILALDWLARTDALASPATIVFWLNLAAVAALLPVGLATGKLLSPELSTLGNLATAVGLTLFGVVQLAVPYALFQLALGRVTAVEASLIVLLEPVLNPMWAWLAVGEAPGWWTAAGGALLVVALVVEAVRFKRKASTTPVR